MLRLRKKGVFVIAVLVFISLFYSCGVTVRESFFTGLANSDYAIARAQYEQAYKVLKKLEKKAINSEQVLSISKRYINMHYYPAAKKMLSKAVKKFPNDTRLVALYSWVLLKCDDITLAYENSKILENTDYCGIYAESALKEFSNRLEKNNDLENKNLENPALSERLSVEQIKEEYIKQDLQNVYLIAYRVSNQTKFLQNAAIYECCKGNFSKAFSYHPIKLPNDESAEFWMLVSYDSQNYLKTIEDASVIGNRDAKLKAKSYVLSADAYLRMKEIVLAQKMWDSAFTLDERSEPSVFVNYALSYINQGEIEKAVKYVKKAVELFPDYFPSLSLYCQFAINDSVKPSESSLALALRKTGLRSLEMIELDKREKIQISDALYRMEQSYERTKNPKIQVELLKLKWANEANLSKMEMISDIWSLLESFYTNEEQGDNSVLDFAIETFMKQDEFLSSSMLLEKRLQSEFSDTDCISHLDELSYQECRMFAAIKHHDGFDDSAKSLL